MVRQVIISPEFVPGFVPVGGQIPKFQYKKSLQEELGEKTLSREECTNILKCMLAIRNFEDMICELRERKGKYGTLKYLYIGASHLSIGQEAVSVGAISPLLPHDYITSTHRGHGDSLAKGYFAIHKMDSSALVDILTKDMEISQFLGFKVEGKTYQELLEQAIELHLFRAIAELFGKDAGYCKGRGGGMHIADFSKGHLGTSAIVGGGLGIAVGSGIASRYFNDKRVTISFVGDGALNNGIAHEAMNMATMAQFTNGLMSTQHGVPVIFAVTNNQYGMTGQQRGEVTGIDFLAERCFGYNKEGMYAEIVNGMDVLAVRDACKRATDRARKGQGPVFLEFWCYRLKGHSLSDRLDKVEDETYRTLEEFKLWKKKDPLTGFAEKLISEKIITLEEFNALKREARTRNEKMAQKAIEAKSPDPKSMYFGLFSNTTSNEIPEEFKNAPIRKRPLFLERDPGIKITYREAIIEALFLEMRRDKRTVLWGEDIAEHGGAFNATKGLFEVFGRDRIFNTAISETAIIGSGVGAALRGLRPVVEIMFIDFILQALDQLGNQAAKLKYMSGGQPAIPLTVRTTIGGGKGYAGQHSQSLEAILAHLPGLKIVAPSNAYDAKGILISAIRDDNPVVFLEHQNLYAHPLARAKVPKEEYVVPLGQARVRREAHNSNRSITVIVWSAMVPLVLKAAKNLEKENIDLEIVDVMTLYPLDIDTIEKSVQKTNKAIIVHQAIQFAGLGAEISAEIYEKTFDYLDGPVVRITAPNTPPPSSSVLERVFLPSEEDIITVAKNLVG